MQKRWIWCLLLAVVVAAGLAWTGVSRHRSQQQPYQQTKFAMDTIIEITAYGDGAPAAVAEALAEFDRIEKLASHFDDNSQVTAINRLAGSEKVAVDPVLFDMIVQSLQLSNYTHGAFDVTIGPLTELWNIGHKGDFIPSQAEIDAVLPLVDANQVEIDKTARTVFLKKAGMQLDLGGRAKEYAVYRAAAILKAAANVHSAMINAGGDIQVIGRRPDGAPWRIGVQHPRDSEALVAKIAMDEWDVVQTSGDYQRYFIKDGRRYCHIIDPANGRQPQGVASVTLLACSQQTNVMSSSALFVLGVEQGMKVLQNFPGVEAIFVTTDGQIIATPGLAGKLE